MTARLARAELAVVRANLCRHRPDRNRAKCETCGTETTEENHA